MKEGAMQTNNKLRDTLVSVKKSIDEMGAASLDGDPEILLMSLTQVCARLSAKIDAALAESETTEESSALP